MNINSLNVSIGTVLFDTFSYGLTWAFLCLIPNIGDIHHEQYWRIEE